MEERTAQKLLKIIGEVKIQQEDIWKKIVGDPTEGKNGRGIINRLDTIEDRVEVIEKKGVRVKWFWAGWGTAAGATTVAGVKSKLVCKTNGIYIWRRRSR